ncbi:OmpW family outer membrane protein [Aquabacterium sp.]|uniref:OmpW/AlkL family protein n=1 Tax=Aquabacterium sp. TaxID=1872578 RepID=UPI0025C6779E|nr:OmpW family outer membrane protein [Aquabacterium sp.]
MTKTSALTRVAAAALALSALSAPLMAQTAEGPWLVRARAVHLEAANKDSIAITDVSINSKWMPEVDFTYFITRNIAAELILTYPQKQDVSSSAHGGKIGTLKHLPPTLTVQYHFLPEGQVRPYVGAGLNYTRFSSVSLPAGFSIEKSSWGPALQAGLDIPVAKNVYLNVDVKKVYIRTDLSANGTNLGTIKVDPVLFGIGIGYRF